MKIDPTISLAIKILLFLITAVGAAASGAPEHFGGKEFAENFVFWDTLAGTIITGVYSLVGTGAVPSVTLTGKVQ